MSIHYYLVKPGRFSFDLGKRGWWVRRFAERSVTGRIHTFCLSDLVASAEELGRLIREETRDDDWDLRSVLRTQDLFTWAGEEQLAWIDSDSVDYYYYSMSTRTDDLDVPIDEEWYEAPHDWERRCREVGVSPRDGRTPLGEAGV